MLILMALMLMLLVYLLVVRHIRRNYIAITEINELTEKGDRLANHIMWFDVWLTCLTQPPKRIKDEEWEVAVDVDWFIGQCQKYKRVNREMVGELGLSRWNFRNRSILHDICVLEYIKGKLITYSALRGKKA